MAGAQLFRLDTYVFQSRQCKSEGGVIVPVDYVLQGNGDALVQTARPFHVSLIPSFLRTRFWTTGHISDISQAFTNSCVNRMKRVYERSLRHNTIQKPAPTAPGSFADPLCAFGSTHASKQKKAVNVSKLFRQDSIVHRVFNSEGACESRHPKAGQLEPIAHDSHAVHFEHEVQHYEDPKQQVRRKQGVRLW